MSKITKTDQEWRELLAAVSRDGELSTEEVVASVLGRAVWVGGGDVGGGESTENLLEGQPESQRERGHERGAHQVQSKGSIEHGRRECDLVGAEIRPAVGHPVPRGVRDERRPDPDDEMAAT